MNFQEFKNKFQKWPVKELPNKVTKKPLVSVCVQTYQHKNFITECLENILNQETSFEYEILLGDDGSTDGTHEICVEFAEKCPDKIRLFLHDRRNQIKVLNEATGNFPAFYNIFSARGNYIAICEGDDYWTDPLKLQKQVEFLEKKSLYSFSFHMYHLVGENGELIENKTRRQPKKDVSSKELIMTSYHPLPLTICFRNKIKDFPKEITEVINVDTFLLSLLGHYGKAKFQDNITPSVHRVHSGGIWGERKIDKKFLSKLLLYKKLEGYYIEIKKFDVANHFKEHKVNTQKMLFYHCVKRGHIIDALKSLYLS